MKSRIISLTPAFLEYLREDGLWLPDDAPYEETPWSDQNSHKASDPTFDDDARPNDASAFADIHQKILETIVELGGSVVPKLNWSSPKDALHMALAKNSMECKSPNDIYLLLKSSIFVTHDLEHAFEDCVDTSPRHLTFDDIPYSLILRPYFKINTTYEFRCFVKDRTLIAISQRDLKFVGYSDQLLRQLENTIQGFFDDKLKISFPDPSFSFDVYVPEPHNRVRLIDINPWAPRTDPLLFSWLELLTTTTPNLLLGVPDSSSSLTNFPPSNNITSSDEDTEDDTNTEIEEIPQKVTFRIVHKDDPEAYNFGTAPYSAHKLPREVVDASLEGGGAMRELMGQWEALMRGESVEGMQQDESDSGDDTQTPTSNQVT